MNILQKIFSEHFESVESSGIKIRLSVLENVKKMQDCGNVKKGFTLYGCEHCGRTKVVPFRVKAGSARLAVICTGGAEIPRCHSSW